MKKYILALACVLTFTACVTSTQESDKPYLEQDVYKLYPTKNMWTFIKLNTCDGRLWQVQYDVRGEDRFEVVLSDIQLANIENASPGRFELYETQNMYNFILLDQITGNTWQAQWSMEEEHRGIVPISQ